MIDKELQCEDFKVEFTNGCSKTYKKTDSEEYSWVLTSGGGLVIYKKTKHQLFHATLRDGRIKAYAPGTWETVTVLEKEKDLDGAV